jgi:hypothetical protein
MIALIPFQQESLIHPLNTWEEECLDNPNSRINNSFSVQVFSLLKRIQEVVPTAEPLTYDFLADIDAQKKASIETNDPDKIKGFKDIWFALAFYLKRIQLGNTLECYEFAHAFNKSVKSGFYGLQAVTIAAGTPLFMTPHKVGSRDIDVITLNGNCSLTSGVTIASVSSDRDRKRWEAVTRNVFLRNGKSEDEARRLTESLGSEVGNLLSKPDLPAIEHAAE